MHLYTRQRVYLWGCSKATGSSKVSRRDRKGVLLAPRAGGPTRSEIVLLPEASYRMLWDPQPFPPGLVYCSTILLQLSVHTCKDYV